jgi:hypothetical protein
MTTYTLADIITMSVNYDTSHSLTVIMTATVTPQSGIPDAKVGWPFNQITHRDVAIVLRSAHSV